MYLKRIYLWESPPRRAARNYLLHISSWMPHEHLLSRNSWAPSEALCEVFQTNACKVILRKSNSVTLMRDRTWKHVADTLTRHSSRWKRTEEGASTRLRATACARTHGKIVGFMPAQNRIHITPMTHPNAHSHQQHSDKHIRKEDSSPRAEILTPRLICLQTICHRLSLHRHFPLS